MSIAVAITLLVVVFGLGIIAGFEGARQWFMRRLDRYERELQWLREQLRDREHPA